MRALGLATAALLLAVGCVPEARLQPSAEAQLARDDRDAAWTEVSGVSLVADGAAWSGTPGNLERSLTPVLVRVENHSGRPLRLQHDDFTLVGAESSFRYSAMPLLPPRDGGAPPAREGTGGSGYTTSGHTSTSLYLGYGAGYGWGWGVGWGYGWWYPGPSWRYGGWGPPGSFVAPYSSPYYPGAYYGGYACEEPLPTKDMLVRALPEGELEDGGRVEGFLYFQNVAERESQVVLQARLVDASTGEPVGTLDIPFQVKKD